MKLVLGCLLALSLTVTATTAIAQTSKTPTQLGNALLDRHSRASAKIKARVDMMINRQHAAAANTPASELATGPRPALAELAVTNPSNTICPVWMDVCNPSQ